MLKKSKRFRNKKTFRNKTKKRCYGGTSSKEVLINEITDTIIRTKYTISDDTIT